jgi:lipoyl(octanoyl) transferase
MSRSPRIIRAYWLGRIGYRHCWDLQRALVEQVRAGAAPSTLLLLEHDPVFSMGRRATFDHVLWDEAERRRRDVELVWSDRGGDVTYHGPGQLVGYPILDLPALGTDILSYIRGLERSLIAYLAELGLESEPGGKDLTGVWSGGAKVAAIGVKLTQRVSNHGFALNLTAGMDYFEGIVPCGLDGKAVTSVELLGGPRLSVETAARAYGPHFEREFGCRLEWREAAEVLPLAAQAPPEPPPLRSLTVVSGK